jgi:AcrR family transcriptional regulator
LAESRRSFNRETPELRQQALIQSTLSLIARGGPDAATVRTIAEEAGVTQGLIRHYFKSKEELVSAAYEAHMNGLMDATSEVLDGEFQSAHARLTAFVMASLTPPVVDPRAMSLWAGFINSVLRDEAMRAIHKKTYLRFRDCIEELVRDALEEAGQRYDANSLRRLAIACNAVIDGLWLEGGALPESFEPGELAEVGLSSVGAIIGLNLERVVG